MAPSNLALCLFETHPQNRRWKCSHPTPFKKVVTPKCPPGVLALTPHEIGQYEYSNDGFALAGVTFPTRLLELGLRWRNLGRRYVNI